MTCAFLSFYSSLLSSLAFDPIAGSFVLDGGGALLPMGPHCIHKVSSVYGVSFRLLPKNSRQRWTQPAVLTPSQLSFLRSPTSSFLQLASCRCGKSHLAGRRTQTGPLASFHSKLWHLGHGRWERIQ
ncbi:hypothetical protein BDP81DRAFT_35704 [Colletotrichum phormii]|uniref:Secreted protein n=1 Tax=Colletotrichum phormii TaxID=359342 RepID=A0AAI9ZSX9_9PEZI|nr:uncharacterized protein BDP81DRAFT_35704 [Colletotrichum phormii]KAK1636254.1 hypothetical protein BDP81DRAFT_35704 [Colletotrichum phormii]